MSDLQRLGHDVTLKLKMISRGIMNLGAAYINDQIKGKQLQHGLRNALAQIEQQLDRLDVTMFGDGVEDYSGYNNDNTVLNGMREDLSKLNTGDPTEADTIVDVDF